MEIQFITAWPPHRPGERTSAYPKSTTEQLVRLGIARNVAAGEEPPKAPEPKGGNGKSDSGGTYRDREMVPGRDTSARRK